MNFRHTLAASCALIPVALLSTPAFAQSTGSVDFDDEIVVTGIRGPPTSPASHARHVEGQGRSDAGSHRSVRTPGQTSSTPSTSFPASTSPTTMPIGSAGGTADDPRLRADRISLTFDGVPLNDSGNYAIYSNQQLDPELIEQVNVNLGSTDVDSPTAAAIGFDRQLSHPDPGRRIRRQAGRVRLVTSASSASLA